MYALAGAVIVSITASIVGMTIVFASGLNYLTRSKKKNIKK